MTLVQTCSEQHRENILSPPAPSLSFAHSLRPQHKEQQFVQQHHVRQQLQQQQQHVQQQQNMDVVMAAMGAMQQALQSAMGFSGHSHDRPGGAEYHLQQIMYHTQQLRLCSAAPQFIAGQKQNQHQNQTQHQNQNQHQNQHQTQHQNQNQTQHQNQHQNQNQNQTQHQNQNQTQNHNLSLMLSRTTNTLPPSTIPSTSSPSSNTRTSHHTQHSQNTKEYKEYKEYSHTSKEYKEFKEYNDEDVLCGKGAHGNHHYGNQRYKDLVRQRLPDYADSMRDAKKEVSAQIVREVRRYGGRFLEKDPNTGLFSTDVGDEVARKKTSQLFRDFLIEKYRNKRAKHVSNSINSMNGIHPNNNNNNNNGSNNNGSNNNGSNNNGINNNNGNNNNGINNNTNNNSNGYDNKPLNAALARPYVFFEKRDAIISPPVMTITSSPPVVASAATNPAAVVAAAAAAMSAHATAKANSQLPLSAPSMESKPRAITTTSTKSETATKTAMEHPRPTRSVSTDSIMDESKPAPTTTTATTATITTPSVAPARDPTPPPAAAAAARTTPPPRKSQLLKLADRVSAARFELPHTVDVLCGRGAHGNHHKGNQNWKELTRELAPKYFDKSANREEKMLLVAKIVDNVRRRGGRFLKKEPGTDYYVDIGDKEARRKTSQLFRDLNHRAIHPKKPKTMSAIAAASMKIPPRPIPTWTGPPLLPEGVGHLPTPMELDDTLEEYANGKNKNNGNGNKNNDTSTKSKKTLPPKKRVLPLQRPKLNGMEVMLKAVDKLGPP